MDKTQVDAAQRVAEEAYTKFALLKDAFFKAESEYIKKLATFKSMDYELAKTDGRLKKVPSSEHGGRKEKKQPVLTLDQLKAIAEKLGFNLNEVGEPNQPDEQEGVDEEIVEAIMAEEEEAKVDEAKV